MKPACRHICDLLTQYADGTLEAEQCAEVQRHLEACPPCRVIAGKECGARQLLRACAHRLRTEQVPSALRSRCQVLSEQSAAAHLWSRRAVRLAVAAVLIIFTGSLVSVVTRQSDALLAAQLTADHVKCFTLFGHQDGGTLDAVQAQRMLGEQFGMDVHVPPSSASDGLALVNARRCLYADGRIPHLMYQAKGQDISLFVLQGESRPPAEFTAFGHHTRIWSRGDRTFVLITPAAEAPIAEAARYVAAEAR
jgi:anti-sigma factor (TIGR02949 family)